MSTSTQTSSQEASQERLAFGIGITKLKSAKSNSLCKRVLLLNSLGSLMQATPSLGAESLPCKFTNKEEWRKYMVREFLTTQTDPEVSFKLVSSPKAVQIDSLSVLMDCLQISQKKRSSPTPGIRTVRKRTIAKNFRKARN